MALTSKSTGVGTVYAMLLEIIPYTLDISGITGLNCWLKPESIDAIAVGGAIASWADSSPLNTPFIQASSSYEPTVSATLLNGYKQALFNGTNKQMYRTAALFSVAMTQVSLAGMCWLRWAPTVLE